MSSPFESGGEWKPYVVGDTHHPGVLICDEAGTPGRKRHARITQSGYTLMHRHSGKETITVVSGEGSLLLADTPEAILLKPGVRVEILPGMRHSVRNTIAATLELIAEFDPPFPEQTTILD
jgi:oxalate decarboxylase/phosphoglucose isomerase-like protein (cupin superfamily)